MAIESTHKGITYYLGDLVTEHHGIHSTDLVKLVIVGFVDIPPPEKRYMSDSWKETPRVKLSNGKTCHPTWLKLVDRFVTTDNYGIE